MYGIAKTIEKIDKLVFENNSIEEIIFIRGNIQEGEGFTGYLSKENSRDGRECYWIMSDVNRKVIDEFIPFDRVKKDGKIFPPFSKEELFVRIAAHEVRHRVQSHFSINLFSPKNSENAKDPYLKWLLTFLHRIFEISPPRHTPKKLEFDAQVIEAYAGKIWVKNRNLIEVAKIVRGDAKTLLNKK